MSSLHIFSWGLNPYQEYPFMGRINRTSFYSVTTQSPKETYAHNKKKAKVFLRQSKCVGCKNAKGARLYLVSMIR